MTDSKARNLTIFCSCSERLLRYNKRGKGRLVKINPERITQDYAGIFTPNLKESTDIFCSTCKNRTATVKNISGRWYFKLNQGQIGLIRKS